MEGVGLLGRGGEAVAQHDGDEALDALRRALDTKVEGLGRSERLSEDHDRLHVGVLEGLTHHRQVNNGRLRFSVVLNLLGVHGTMETK